MNKQQVLASKIAQLSGDDYDPVDDAGLKLIEQDPELQQEIKFLETLWHQDVLPMQIPSTELDLGFYKMLAIAQSGQSKHVAPPKSVDTTTNLLVRKLKSWFTLRTVPQFAALVIVFMLGFYLNKEVNQGRSSQQLSALNDQVSSLNTMMAISLLQQPSASERLAGVAFTKKANMQHQELSQLVIQTLRNDNATPVKLAMINALSNSAIGEFESELLNIVRAEKNVLVQIELSRLLFTQGSHSTIQELLKLGTSVALHPDMNQWIKDIKATASI